MKDFTHFDARGHARMVEVTDKAITHRRATAEGFIWVGDEVMDAIVGGQTKKGDVLGVARIAGIMAAKRTSEWIPLCHPLPISGCEVDFELDPVGGRVRAICTVQTTGPTGVEMEAITGVQIALTTIYDMCKAISKAMEITGVRLLDKSGGKSGHYRAASLRRPPVVGICGLKNSGKTTFLEGLIPRLTDRGLRVALLKHDGHDFTPDLPGTDSYRLAAAGASPVGVYSKEHFQLSGGWTRPHPERLLEGMAEADLILLEGGKTLAIPKLEIVRSGISDRPVCEGGQLLAICTDLAIESDLPLIGLTDYEAAAEILLAYLEGMQ